MGNPGSMRESITSSAREKRRVSFSRQLSGVEDSMGNSNTFGGIQPTAEMKDRMTMQRYDIQEGAKFQMFYLNDDLADFVLVDGDTGKKYNCHRVVLASASKLIKDFLSLRKNQDGSAIGPGGLPLKDAAAIKARTLELNKLSSNFEFKTPRRYVRMRIAEEENILFEQVILRYIYENQNFEKVKILINNKRVAAVLDLAIALQMDSLFQMTFVHLCENILPNNKNLFSFDHGYMEFIMSYIDKHEPSWANF